jgi:2,3-bisphosphoglycerate-dependent phosphoglycerate mutase
VKRIYFVRHGESTSNVSHVVQGSEDILTAAGEKQAEVLAERLSKLPFHNLLVSDFVRTRQTVAPLLEKVSIKPVYTELLREARRPSSLVGSPINGEGFVNFDKLSRAHVLEADWRFEDEENYHDIVLRIKNLFAQIDTFEGDTVLVSHGRLAIYIMMYVIMGGKLTPDVWRTDFATFTTTNTGVTVFSYKEHEKLWAVSTYNDHAHFAE